MCNERKNNLKDCGAEKVLFKSKNVKKSFDSVKNKDDIKDLEDLAD